MRTGTSTRGPMTAAKASPEPIPKTATATAIASSKLLLAAVKAMVVVINVPLPQCNGSRSHFAINFRISKFLFKAIRNCYEGVVTTRAGIFFVFL
jgi:hypothetical protein